MYYILTLELRDISSFVIVNVFVNENVSEIFNKEELFEDNLFLFVSPAPADSLLNLQAWWQCMRKSRYRHSFNTYFESAN